MSKRESEVTRRIYFYKVQHKDEVLGALPGDLARIGNLPFTENGRYMKDGEGTRFAAWPDSFDYPLKLRFGRTRLSNLPTKELAGKLEALDLAVVEGMPVISFLELKGQPNAAGLLGEADKDLGRAYSTIGHLGANKAIALGFTAEQRPDSKLRGLALKMARMAKTRSSEVHDSLRLLKVQGFTAQGRLDEVDLLEEHLIALKTIERVSEKGKALSADSAYEQIDAAYQERRDELQDAVVGRRLFQ